MCPPLLKRRSDGTLVPQTHTLDEKSNFLLFIDGFNYRAWHYKKLSHDENWQPFCRAKRKPD